MSCVFVSVFGNVSLRGAFLSFYSTVILTRHNFKNEA